MPPAPPVRAAGEIWSSAGCRCSVRPGGGWMARISSPRGRSSAKSGAEPGNPVEPGAVHGQQVEAFAAETLGQEVAGNAGDLHGTHSRNALEIGVVQAQGGYGLAVSGVLDPHVGAHLVAGAVFLAALQGGTEGAADYPQGGSQHQQHYQAAGGDGVAAHTPHALHQPDRADGFDKPG